MLVQVHALTDAPFAYGFFLACCWLLGFVHSACIQKPRCSPGIGLESKQSTFHCRGADGPTYCCQGPGQRGVMSPLGYQTLRALLIQRRLRPLSSTCTHHCTSICQGLGTPVLSALSMTLVQCWKMACEGVAPGQEETLVSNT